MSDTPPRRSFWKRRLGDPIIALLTQGVTPDKIAATLAIGTSASLFPFFGFTTTLNIVVGLCFRMNQPLLQVINYLLAPVHLVMILVYVRIGEWIWGAGDDRFTLTEVFETFRHNSLREFLHRFGWAGVHAFTAWAISVPFIICGIYFCLRPLMHRLARLAVRKTSA
ncbi:MAG: DUF2062 domain-containing protein [Opitutaceae bacterium]|jgi:uncharacterized protein (DUF2062 family)